MLRYPSVKSADLIRAVPQLGEIDPMLLERLDIDGTYNFLSPCMHTSSYH